MRATSDCNSGLSCVYPTAPACGVAYCCKVDAQGNVTDTNPICQPDPALQALCMVDLGASATSDGGSADAL